MRRAMTRLPRILIALIIVVLLIPSTALADLNDDRLKALENRVTTLERAAAYSRIDVVGLVTAAAPAVVSVYQVDKDNAVRTQGTGFIVDDRGIIITNAHVVANNYNVKVKFSNGKTSVASKMLVDPFLDMAVLTVDGTGFPILPWAKKKPQVGDPLVVIGNAYGYSNSVTMGIVSGLDRPDPYHVHHYPSLQTDAAINHGNSGGPILNAQGEVVAMATWGELKDSSEGISFGIPIEQIATAIGQYVEGRGIVRPWLGVAVQEPYWSRGGLPNDFGLFVSDVSLTGPAAFVLQRFDWITAVNGIPVNYLMELRAQLEKYKPGTKVTLTVVRSNAGAYKTFTVEVTLGEYSAVVKPSIPLYYDSTTDDLF